MWRRVFYRDPTLFNTADQLFLLRENIKFSENFAQQGRKDLRPKYLSK